jgi:anti-sigma B factor antagonist
MKQEMDQAGNVAILRLNGRFDSAQANNPKIWLEEAAKTAPAQIVVNLEQVNFVDSTALATLVQGMKRARQQGGDLYLAHLQPPVRMIFELTRLDKAFAIYASEGEAVRAFD